MKQPKHTKITDFIEPVCMNGLQGRMLHLPAPAKKNREILFVYGHHATIERVWGIAEDLNQYGAVTVPDLPGFGGMESFYKIDELPTIDNFADYLAAFIKLRYKRKRITLVAMSYGFVVVTRMLQKYPDIAKKVDLLVSAVGFTRHDDFTFSKKRHTVYYAFSRVFSGNLSSLFFKNVCLHPLLIKTVYVRSHNAKHKFENVKPEDVGRLVDFETHLWHVNDLRTHMFSTAEFLRLDNCTKQVDLPVWHIAVSKDQYFDNAVVEQHLRIIFSDVHMTTSKMDGHAPSIIADAAEAAPLIPKKIRQLLSK